MYDRNTEQQNRYLEEVCTCLHRAGFETQPLEDSQMPVYWNGVPLCRITGKGSVFYRREDVNTPLAEDALLRVEDIATQTMEYMTAMETAPQLKASGLEGDYRILADFNGTVLAGMHSKHGVQFVTWDWDYDRTGLSSLVNASPLADLIFLWATNSRTLSSPRTPRQSAAIMRQLNATETGHTESWICVPVPAHLSTGKN